MSDRTFPRAVATTFPGCPPFAHPTHDGLRYSDHVRGVDTAVMHGPDVAPPRTAYRLPLEHTPTLSTFVRDRLAEWCDGYGWDTESVNLPSGERILHVDSAAQTMSVYVDGLTLRDNDDRHMRPITLRGFQWHAEPTDTGTAHGPTRADRPAVIAERFYCTACGASAGDPCRLGDAPQGTIHTARHESARRADYRTDLRTFVGHRVPGTDRRV